LALYLVVRAGKHGDDADLSETAHAAESHAAEAAHEE
jgi:hypothetical protein